jgi:ATPase family associated with various cellular activities (AAA)
VTAAREVLVAPDELWTSANQAFLSAALAVTAGRVAGDDVRTEQRRCAELVGRMATPPALHAIADGFGLSGFERETLLLAAGVELDTKVAQACARAHGDPARPYATFSLAMARLQDPHWTAVSPASPLRRWHLVELAHPEVPTASAMRVDERVLHALAGIGYLDPRIECLAEPLPGPEPLPVGLQAAADRLAELWSGQGNRHVQLRGRRLPDVRSVVSAAAAILGLHPVTLRAADLPATGAERDLLSRLCERETLLDGRCWLLEIDDPLSAGGRAAVSLAHRLRAPVVVACDVPVDPHGGAFVAVDVPAVAATELRDAWRRALGSAGVAEAVWIDRLSGQFSMGVAETAAVVDEVRARTDGSAVGPRLWSACRSRARPALDGLAERVDTRAAWDDLVLPEIQARLLRDMAAHVRHRMRVFEDWGFGRRSARGSGVAGLFAGPSGTGKTFAAEVLAHDLDLDLYRVDLSRVVSKYIGETEKNLRQIFDAAESGGVVLLFDEADALFGKRSEVKDSHDRYANIEVSYLLQRMETYSGMAILTTNLKDAIDTAFVRRLRFIVPFPFPDAQGRAELWRRIFPPELPTEGLSAEKLARLAVAGGTIRSIALSAAFLAAEDGGPVRMPHILAAARTEYAKTGRSLTDTEVAGWTT